MSNSYVPLYVFLGTLFVLGGILPFFISSFVDVSVPNPSSSISGFYNFLNYGFKFSFFGYSIDLDIFFWMPKGMRISMLNNLNAISYAPNYITIPLMITMFFSLVYVVISFIPGLKP